MNAKGDLRRSPFHRVNKMSNFFQDVYKIVGQIPQGKVMSYGQIARILGMPRGARQVGWAMRVCPEETPWQRVVMVDGSIAGGQYADIRRAMLIEEGVIFRKDGKVDMKKCQYEGEIMQ